MVVNTAMLGMLKNPPEPFEDVIRTHFRLKARPITEQLDRWLAEDDGRTLVGDGAQIGPVGKRTQVESDAGGSTNGFAKDVAEMKGLLEALEKGQYSPSKQEDTAMDVDG